MSAVLTTIRPATDHDWMGSVPSVPSGTVASVTSDNSNSTYAHGATGSVSSPYIGVTLGGISALTGTQRIRSCTIRARTAAEAGGNNYQSVEMFLTHMTNFSIPGVADLRITRGLTSIADSTGATAYKAPGGGAWTAAVVNVTRLGTQWFTPTSGDRTKFCRVHELFVDVDINEQPAITGTPTVTNTNTSSPTVTWGYYDLDGDPQASWRVKIFNSLTYSASTFSPDTAVPTWDSGVRNGSDASTGIAGKLINGTTYRAYVMAAQSWPGAQGSLWWSAWAISSPFTISLTPPAAPTVFTVATLTDAAAARALIAVDAPVNLLDAQQANFESNIGNWVADTNMSAPARSTFDAANGVGSMQLSSTAAGDMIARSGFSNDDGGPWVNGGDTYTALASFHAAATGRNCQVGIRWLDINGATISTTFGSSTADVSTAGVYNQATFTGVAPNNAIQALGMVKVLATGGAAEIHRVDKVDIHRGSSTVWSNGGYGPTQAVIIERGERVDNHRGPGENWAHPQVATGGSVTKDNGHGFSVDRSKDLIAWRYLDKFIPGRTTPIGMIAWQPESGTNTNLLIGSAWFYPEWEWNFPIQQGAVHVFSCWAWVSSGTFTTTPKIQWLTDEPASGVVQSTSTGSQLTLTTTPQRVVFSATAPNAASGASGARGVLTNDSSSVSQTVFVTRIGWGLGTLPVDDRPPTGGPRTWTVVRDAVEQYPAGDEPFNLRQFADLECPPGRPVLYRAHVEALANDGINVLTSPMSAHLSAIVTPPAATVLRSVPDPQQGAAVNRRMASGGYTWITDHQLFHPLGRDANPVQIVDWVGGEDGQLVIITPTETQHAALANLLKIGGTYLLQWAQGGETYVLLTDHQNAETLTETNWCDTDGIIQPTMRMAVHQLNYVETGRP